MSERKSYLQLMSEGFRMMKQAKETERTINLRDWTFSFRHDRDWSVILRTERVKWVSRPFEQLTIEPTWVQFGAASLQRHVESNEVRLKIEEEWGIESKVVCDNQEWDRFVEALKQLKGE
ncbi:MAG: hypothetical protein LPJ96_01780 [Exiguobacterium sp.]|uniref:hypothetical protein n=1 Tax=Exiguobacterium sp. AB2 TaxID=1484479 RepID=UPI0004A9853F|nr:hypothetical protein [Exiguobacterium sp. AB2]KDN57580.1 hypothetical protein DI14_11605 [Exiguobacterium sp. AB2]MDX5322319.1 hypothetical protein [Exiguobacterium sp.]MDX5424041.1 hypothetical protein [Exiguobacterium sp.]MDX6771566.1 hypothetical protein [Exiguobacterium sp.]